MANRSDRTAWPAMMDLAAAARFLCVSQPEFRSLVDANAMPTAREILPGVQRWHREAIEAAAMHLWNGSLAEPGNARGSAPSLQSPPTRRIQQVPAPTASCTSVDLVIAAGTVTRGPERFLKLAEVVEMAGLSRGSIYRMMKEGRFPAARQVGRTAVRWLASEVQDWMHQRGAA